jgi:hypothetical protein
MILRQIRDGVTKPYSFSGMQKIVHTMRDKIGLPSIFTLDACRHGGMTELEEAALTDAKAAPCQRTRASKPMKAMPSERWNGHFQQRVSVTRIV